MKFNIELMIDSVPFCIPTEGRTEEDLLLLEAQLENVEFVAYERVVDIDLDIWTYYGVDGQDEMIFNNESDYYKEGKDNVTLLQWEDILLEVKIEVEEPKVERDCIPIPPIGTVCQAPVFGKGELVTGEIIKIRHNGTREVAAVMDSETFEVSWSHKFYPIPKEPTWQEEVSWFLANSNPTDAVFSCGSWMINDVLKEEETFLEMCRVALRAKGEIE